MTMFISLSFILFMMGTCGMFLFSKHMINILMSFELIMLSLNFNFIMFSCYLDDLMGQMYSLFMLTVAAAESSMGLAMMMVYYSLSGGMSMDLLSLLKG